MADEQTQVDETTTTTDSGAAGSETEHDDAFDKDRALATIRKLRENEKALRAQAKDADDLRKRLQAIEDKDKSEVERLAGTAKETSEKLAAAEQRAADLALRLTVERAATRAGFHDPDDAYRLIDRKAVELDDDGEPTNVEALLKDLTKAKPHLVKAEDGDKPAPRSTPVTPKPATNGGGAGDRVQREVEAMRATGRYSI